MRPSCRLVEFCSGAYFILSRAFHSFALSLTVGVKNPRKLWSITRKIFRTLRKHTHLSRSFGIFVFILLFANNFNMKILQEPLKTPNSALRVHAEMLIYLCVNSAFGADASLDFGFFRGSLQNGFPADQVRGDSMPCRTSRRDSGTPMPGVPP
jgi:hypothetical protein